MKRLLGSLLVLLSTCACACAQDITLVGTGNYSVTIQPPPEVYLSAVNTLNNLAAMTIPNGGSAILTWDSHNAASCSGTGFSTGAAVSGTATVSPTTSTTYSVNCGGASTSVTVTVSGTLRNPATDGTCTTHGGGTGTAASPWKSACLQAAVNAASAGDTIFLAAGNWALSTADAAPVTINTQINLVGAGSGNTFDAWGHVNNSSGADFCPTSSSSITCIYGTGTSFQPNTQLEGAGYINVGNQQWAGPSNTLSTTCPNNISHIFFDGSLVTDGGDQNALLVIWQCAGPITVSDIRFLGFDNVATNNGETQFFPNQTQNITIQNSVFSAAASGIVNGSYPNSQMFEFNGGNNVGGQNILIQNNVFYQNDFNPTVLSRTTYTGNVAYQYTDGLGSVGFDPANGWSGSGIGGSIGTFCSEESPPAGFCNGNYTLNYTNSLFYGPGQTLAVGGGVNDPSTSGGLNNLTISGNWLIAATPDIDACEWHLFNDQGNCSPGNAVGMSINMAVDTNCNESNNGTPFTITNNSLIGTTAAYLNAEGTASLNCLKGNDVTVVSVPIKVYGFNAQNNYLSSPSNQYLTNSNTISPTQTNNFCTTSAGTVSGCATSGFTTPPTVSFTLGTLSNGVVQIASPSFTAQYGAVQWLTSTSPTTPLASDSRWSSNNGSFPNSAANSYIPPVSLAGVNHGDTVYMWVMDSANHISAAATTLLP